MRPGSELAELQQVYDPKDAQKERDEARMKMELFYNSNPGLHEFFPEERFRGLINSYLTDDLPPEVVQKRADKMYDDLQNAARPPVSGNAMEHAQSIEALDEAYGREKAVIEQRPDKDPVKSVLLAKLNRRYDELAQELYQR